MKICSNCGNKLSENDKKCIICKTTTKTAIPVDENDKERVDEVIASVRAKGSNNNKSKKKRKGFLPILVIAIVLFIIVSALNGDDSPEEPAQPASNVEGKDTSKPKEEIIIEPEIVVTAKEIIDTFEENEVRGKQTFTGKLAEITGVVGDVGEVLNSTYVTLGTGADFEFIQLQCFFKDEAEINKVAELKSGDTITIIGTIGEQSLNIAVNDCVFK